MAANSFIAPSTPLDRRQLGKYEVLCRLSTGGMSAIYLAHQTGLGGFKKLVVLKTVLPDIEGEEDFVGMFLEEARITAVFNHPNIAQVFELDTDDGQLYMAMEFVQGCTLVEMARACRQAKEPIPVGFTLASVRDTALALHYAHTFTDARGRRQIVIHRDVAEKNIMVTYEGVTKLLDFGIAKSLGRSGRTSIGMVKGTSGYMSPEQIRGEPLDPRSDIFSLGVVLHECLTGLRLFHGKTAEEGMMAALREDVQPPSKWNPQVSPQLDAVVLKALARKREDRFGTALEFARAIEQAAPGQLWYPEQIGELVLRFFADRRAETRRLLESTDLGSERTGEIRVQSVLAKMRATAAPPLAEAKPPDTPRKASLVSAPQVSMPRDTNEKTRPGDIQHLLAREQPHEATRPGVAPLVPQGATPVATPAYIPPGPIDLSTTPARPRSLGATEAVTGTQPGMRRPEALDDEDDGEGLEDKTIPAAALPDEIMALRSQFSSAAAARRAAARPPPPVSTSPGGPDRSGVQTAPERPALPDPVVGPERSTLPATVSHRPAVAPALAQPSPPAVRKPSTAIPALVPAGPMPSAPSPAAPTRVSSGALLPVAAPPPPFASPSRTEAATRERLVPERVTEPIPTARPAPQPRSPSADTLSATGGGQRRTWEDEDDDSKTALEVPEGARAPAARPSLAEPRYDDESVVEAPSRAGLWALLVVLALLAVTGALVLLDVIPLLK